jgi:hypothetical protein
MIPELMFSQILVNGGENSALAQRIGVSDPYKFESPHLYLYKKGESKPIAFPLSAAFDQKGLKNFVSKHTGLAFDPPAMTTELAGFITRFAKEKDSRATVAKEASEQFAGSASAEIPVYLKTMEKLASKADYASTELNRLNGLLHAPKASLSGEKRRDMQTKATILRHFLRVLRD